MSKHPPCLTFGSLKLGVLRPNHGRTPPPNPFDERDPDGSCPYDRHGWNDCDFQASREYIQHPCTAPGHDASHTRCSDIKCEAHLCDRCMFVVSSLSDKTSEPRVFCHAHHAEVMASTPGGFSRHKVPVAYNKWYDSCRMAPPRL